jgi:5-methyltetrahydrofolate--homocysteine methyltransferase
MSGPQDGRDAPAEVQQDGTNASFRRWEDRMAIEEIRQAILEGDDVRAPELVRAQLDAGTTAADIMDLALISAMDEAGERMSSGDMFIPEVLVAADAMKAAMDVLTPHLVGREGGERATVVIGAVEGDIHDIGKSLVALMLEGAGYNVVDLGVDVPIERYRRAAEEHKAEFVAMSALMVTTMPKMKEGIEALRAAGVDAKVIVGGAPVTQAFAERIGAAGYAPDAGGAVKLVRSLA